MNRLYTNGHHTSRLYTAAESRAIDGRAINDLGFPGFDLMCRAARFAANVFLDEWPDAGHACVVAGKGNNAGDGYVMGAMLAQAGVNVRLFQVGSPPDQGDGALAVTYAAERGLHAEAFAADALRGVVVDALLGTGVSGALRAEFAEAVRAINASGCPVMAVDLPTGVNADTGGPVGPEDEVVRADVTPTFIARKIGLHTGYGLEVCGREVFDDLQVPRQAYAGGVPWLRQLTPRVPLRTNAYKHARGHVVVVGGHLSMGGAVILAGEAALRCGAGMVTIATRPEHRPAVLARRPEIMVMDADDRDALAGLLNRATVVVLGPGLGRDAWSSALYRFVMDAEPERLLVDADGLYHLADRPSPLSAKASVVTPHVAEAARLLGSTAREVQIDRPAAARALHERFGAVSVLKGAGSLVAGDAGISICGRGTPAMATAGMGDVLCGVIAAGLCRAEAYEAVCEGVLKHAVAGEQAHERVGDGLVATDLFPELARL